MSVVARASRPAARRARGAAARARGLRLLVALGIAAWLFVGLSGVAQYVHGYSVYRGFPPPVTPKGLPTGVVTTLRFFSPALGRPSAAEVYLPPGYTPARAKGRRYGVLYLLHGTPGKAANMFQAGAVGRDANVLIDRHRIRPLILVAPYGRSGYRNPTEWANGRNGPFERYLLDVVRTVDARLPTIANRGHRVIAGDSEGAYGAANVALRNLGVFSGFQSWSGYFSEKPTGTFRGATPALVAANSPMSYVPSLAPALRRHPLHAFVYQGAHERGGTYEMATFVAELRAAGVVASSGVYPGGHDWGLWRSQMPRMLAAASRWMSAKPARPHARRAAPRRAHHARHARNARAAKGGKP